jgi:hypothetical protein
MTVTFGPGPLSLFNYDEVSTAYWAWQGAWDIFPTLTPIEFYYPRSCGGSLPVTSDITGLPATAIYGVNWVTEIVMGNELASPINSKMAPTSLIAALSAPSSYSHNARGAFLATNYFPPLSLLWTAAVWYDPSTTTFYAPVVEIYTGNIIFNILVNERYYSACIK